MVAAASEPEVQPGKPASSHQSESRSAKSNAAAVPAKPAASGPAAASKPAAKSSEPPGYHHQNVVAVQSEPLWVHAAAFGKW